MNQSITILYASMTGNARDCAETAAKKLKQAGHAAEAVDLANYRVSEVANERTVLVTISTWGEGEPPDDGVNFVEHLRGLESGSLPNLEFAVLALGDTSYDQFCQCGRDVDALFEQLGARRLAERVDCDVDFQEGADAWLASVIAALADRVANPAA